MTELEKEITENLMYNPETGEIWWKKRGAGRPFNRPAGSKNKDGYVKLNILGRIHLAHRVAWYLYYSEWPKNLIDHINGDKHDNRIDNLRVASISENIANSILRRNNTSGYRGVSKVRSGKWRACIRIHGKQTVLGLYITPEEAAEKYAEAAKKLYGEFFNERPHSSRGVSC